jgi:hypothetical protein
LQGHLNSLLGEVRAMLRVMTPPRTVIVPPLMVWIRGINPQGNF